MLDEMRTFVVLAESGSLQRAAERLFLTPSAVTRQIQRLEAALKTPLLDRRVKPGRITREGRAVLDRGRQMLRIMDDLKASGAKDAEPSGIFRVGLSHALAQPSLVASIQRLTSRFPRLQPVLSTDLRQQLIEQVRTGELDVALAFLSADDTMPGDVASSVLAAERLVLVRARGPQPRARRSSKSKDHALDGRWVLNPPGCFIRAVTRGEVARTRLSVRSRRRDQQYRHASVSRGERDRPRAHPLAISCLASEAPAAGANHAVRHQHRGVDRVHASRPSGPARNRGDISPTRVSRPFRRARGSLIATTQLAGSGGPSPATRSGQRRSSMKTALERYLSIVSRG